MLELLPSDVQSKLRSGVAITSLSQCVEELVLNSLDAGAVCIAIRVDMTCFTVQIVDNGMGISKEDLNLIGERYSTSKCHKLEDLDKLEYFGYRGEALSSLRDISTVLEIHSRFRQSPITYCKLFKHGKAGNVEDSKYPRPCPGTTITIHNVFYNLPVRQKNIIDGLELERIRYRVEGISLINPSVSFSLRNDATGHVLLQTQKSNSILTAFMYLFGGGLSKHLKPLSAEKKDFQLEGYIGNTGHTKKNLQFVYVNGRLVLKTKVHKMVAKVMANCSLFKRKRTDLKDETPTRTLPRNGDKYSIFVIHIKCPYTAYDITFDPRKTLVEFKDWDTLTCAVETMVTNFLKAEHLWNLIDVVSSKTPENNTPLQDEEHDVTASKCEEHTDDTLHCDHENKNKVCDSTELNISSEISTINTNNSLFSKTVRRDCSEEITSRTSDPILSPKEGIETEIASQSPKISNSGSQIALEEVAQKLLIQIIPNDVEFTSDDEIPVNTKKPRYRIQETTSSSDLSTVNSDKDGDEDLFEDPIPSKTSKLLKSIPKYDPYPEFIALPSDNNTQKTTATLSLFRSKQPSSEGECNLTAAQKISLKLREKSKNSLPRDEIISKISSSLDKFRKKSRFEQKRESNETLNVIKLTEKTSIDVGKVYVSNTNNKTQLISEGEPTLNISRFPLSRELKTQNSSNFLPLESNISNNCHLQAANGDNNIFSEKKRENQHLNDSNDASEPKRSKFMTSASFMMTPKTALVEVLPLLKQMQRQTQAIAASKTVKSDNIQENRCMVSFADINDVNLRTVTPLGFGNKTSTNIEQTSSPEFPTMHPLLDTTFRKPLPVIDHSRRYPSSKFSPEMRLNKIYCDESDTELNPETIDVFSDSDLRPTSNCNTIISSQGFDFKMSAQSDVVDKDKLPEEEINFESQGFPLADSESDYHLKQTNQIANITDLPLVSAISNREEIFSSSYESSSHFPCAQQEDVVSVIHTADSYSITDLLSDLSQKSPGHSCIPCQTTASPKANQTQDVMETDMSDELMQKKNQSVFPGCDACIIGNTHQVSHEQIKVVSPDLAKSETESADLLMDSCGSGNVKCSSSADTVETSSENIWTEIVDSNEGSKIYVNQLTGNSLYENDWMILQSNLLREETNKPHEATRKNTTEIIGLCSDETQKLQDMITNHFDDKEEKLIKWRNKNDDTSTGKTGIDKMFDLWQNPVHERSNQCGVSAEVNHTSRSAMMSYQSLNQIQFTKDMLSCMEVLGQVDSKFIACLISTASHNSNSVPDLLVMMDQHAAHERVRLEQFISELFEDDVEESDVVKRSTITPPIVLNLCQEDVRVINCFKHEFSRIGIQFTCPDNIRNQINLHTIPACIVEREANELKRGKRSIAREFVEELITEHVEYLNKTSGSRRRLPLSLHKILATKACRGAIKFNDNLSKTQCKELIDALSGCDLPFQCAHGRPSVIPLVKLDDKLQSNREVPSRPRLDKLLKGMALDSK